MFIFERDGALEEIAEFRNAHGFCPAIWTPICRKHLGNEYEWLTGKPERLWPLYKDERMPLHWRVALACSYDHAIISESSRRLVADCLRKFYSETWVSGYANHLSAIADKLDALPLDCIGACFHGTSVSENPWNLYDEDKDAMVPYDLTDNKHFFVLESVGLLQPAFAL